MDVFKLPGDRLTSTSAIQHIPTRSIPNNRPITLRNYRIPKHQKVENQVKQMLKDGIIHQIQSPWNFPIFVAPKQLDEAGKRKWRICVDFKKLYHLAIVFQYQIFNIFRQIRQN